jgi:hypothetical protein
MAKADGKKKVVGQRRRSEEKERERIYSCRSNLLICNSATITFFPPLRPSVYNPYESLANFA